MNEVTMLECSLVIPKDKIVPLAESMNNWPEFLRESSNSKIWFDPCQPPVERVRDALMEMGFILFAEDAPDGSISVGDFGGEKWHLEFDDMLDRMAPFVNETSLLVIMWDSDRSVYQYSFAKDGKLRRRRGHYVFPGNTTKLWDRKELCWVTPIVKERL